MKDIKKNTVSGFFWSSLGTVGSGVINFAVTLVLARLLTPSDFGVLELIIVVTAISNVFVDSGFSQALIRDKNAEDIDFSSVFYVNLLIAILLYFFLFFITPILTSFFNIGSFNTVFRFCFLTIIIEAFSIVQNTIYAKKMQFKPIALASITSIIIGGFASVLIAFKGLGIWSLSIFIVLNSCVRTLVLWHITTWRPSFVFSILSVKKYFKFGFFLLLQGIFDKITINIESLTIGKFYSRGELGYFSQSRKIDAYFSQTLTNVITKVTYPALIQISDSTDRLREGYRKTIGITTFIIFPLMIFCITFSYDFISVLYGDKWLPVAPLLSIWCVFGLIYPLQSICNNIFLVKGQTKQLFYISSCKQLVKIAAVIILSPISINAILYGVVAVGTFSSFIFTFFSGKLIQYSLIQLGKDVYKNLFVSLLSSITIFLIFRSLHIENIYFLLLIKFSGFTIIYFIVNKYINNHNFGEFNEILKELFSKNKLHF